MSDHSPASRFGSQIENENFTSPPEPGQGRVSWIPESLPNETYLSALSYYAGLIEQGHTEYMAQIKTKELFFPDPPAQSQDDDEDEETIYQSHIKMKPYVKIVLVVLSLLAVAWFIYSKINPSTPLDQAIKARNEAARIYAKSHLERLQITKQDDLNKAAYEKAYKREACIINGTCR